MKPLDIPTVAVIADAHLHDIQGDYDGASLTVAEQKLTLRSWSDTRRSSRVFNESRMAFVGALEDLVKRGIKHVVLLGDYADDGQIEAIQNVVAILKQFRHEHGVNFYALPGNHDYYGPAGKHQSTRFAISAQQSVLVTSDPQIAEQEPESAILTRKMFCLGAPEGLLPMAEFGFCRQAEYLHWETPFGISDNFDTRQYCATSSDGSTSHTLTDASYLVEPSPGLWLLMLDANVYEPRNGTRKINQKKAFLDSSDAGWNSVLRNKPYLLEWISDVCKRASEQGKHLLTFSHYPALDPYNDHDNSYMKLFGESEVSRRQPGTTVAEKLLDAGLQLHFGGHMHVNGVSCYDAGEKCFTHISVPSLVNCPAAYQLIHTKLNEILVDTISIASLPIDSRLITLYKEQSLAARVPVEPALVDAINYGDFLYKRIHSRVLHRHFVKYWPHQIVENVKQTSVADLMIMLTLQKTSKQALLLHPTQASDNSEVVSGLRAFALEHNMVFEDFCNLPMMQLVVDWYCLRDAGSQTLIIIKAERLHLYRMLSAHYGDTEVAEIKNNADFFTVFLGMMHASLQALTNSSTRTSVTVMTR